MAHRRSNSNKIRNLRWSRNQNTFLALAAGTSAQTLVTAGSDTETLMRLHVELVAWVDGTQTPSVLTQVAVGAIVMPEGQGTTVVSSPITDDNAPWLFYDRFALGYEEYVTDVIDAPGLTSYRKSIDVKSMRILRPDREVQLVIESTTIASAVSVNVSMSFSGLFGQH